MDYYQDIITQKSWKLLQTIRKRFDVVLIGGWAVWLYSHALKSKDIDIIVDYDVLAELGKQFPLVKNARLKKYEAKEEEIDIDIYVPYYSDPGLPAETIQSHVVTRESFRIPRIELLLILKQFVYGQRKGSVKGQKDKLDIISLLENPMDFSLYKHLCKEVGYGTHPQALVQLLQETTRAPELRLDPHRMARLKKRVLAHLASA